VENKYTFQPPRQFGLVFHLVVILGLLAASGWGLLRAANSSMGPVFLLYLLPALISLGLLPIFLYRAYSLIASSYIIHRDGIKLRWGLRIESVPMDAIMWVRSNDKLEKPLPLPWLRWPGAILGLRRSADGSRVEFMASSASPQVVIATQTGLLVISPLEPDFFIEVFDRYWELGSLSPSAPYSIHPSFALARLWGQPFARYLVLFGLLANLVLLSWVITVAPQQSPIILGFTPVGEPVPAVRLLLLPTLSWFIFLVNFFIGLFFFRRADGRPMTAAGTRSGPAARSLSQLIRQDAALISGQVLAYFLWGASALTALLFILAVYFILRVPG
jgi:hypothetical protein